MSRRSRPPGRPDSSNEPDASLSQPTEAAGSKSPRALDVPVAAGGRGESPASGWQSGLSRGWRHWYRRALPAYWLFLFLATHFPKLRLTGPIERPDLYSHFGAFALLAFLLWEFIESVRGAVGPAFVWLAAALLLGYAAVDELTQEFVGRDATVEDWLADAAGALVVLSVLELRRRSAPPR
jgi:VanZ family protein